MPKHPSSSHPHLCPCPCPHHFIHAYPPPTLPLQPNPFWYRRAPRPLPIPAPAEEEQPRTIPVVDFSYFPHPLDRPPPPATRICSHEETADDKYDKIRRLQPIFMGIITLFAIIEGCLTAYLTAKNNNSNKWPDHSFRDRTKFLLFTSWWTVVMSCVYIVFFFWAAGSAISSVLSNLIYIFITWVFWLAGAASFTEAMGGGMRCSHSDLVYCGQNVATEAFAWIEWILLCFLLIVLSVMTFATVSRGDRLSTPAGMA